VEDFTKTKTKTELLQGALDRGLLVAPVTTLDEVVNSEQLASRDYWTTADHGELGQTIRYPGPFAKFSAAPITYRRRPPQLGEHNYEVYSQELGLSHAQMSELQTKGVSRANR
jgi:crotonobetainyl-CoA:carnitine CoA-transferase CaiB-like acyl-CoA transferase